MIPPPIVRAIPATQPEAIAEEAATEVVAVTAVAEAINPAFRRTTSGILIITRNRAY